MWQHQQHDEPAAAAAAGMLNLASRPRGLSLLARAVEANDPSGRIAVPTANAEPTAHAVCLPSASASQQLPPPLYMPGTTMPLVHRVWQPPPPSQPPEGDQLQQLQNQMRFQHHHIYLQQHQQQSQVHLFLQQQLQQQSQGHQLHASSIFPGHSPRVPVATAAAAPQPVKRKRLVKCFRCEQCTQEFTCSSNLTRHRRIHTGQKPYKCQHCNAPFSNSSNRRKHERGCLDRMQRKHRRVVPLHDHGDAGLTPMAAAPVGTATGPIFYPKTPGMRRASSEALAAAMTAGLGLLSSPTEAGRTSSDSPTTDTFPPGSPRDGYYSPRVAGLLPKE